MQNNGLVVFVHVVGTPDTENAPGLLTTSDGVLVRGPAPELPPGGSYEVVITASPPAPKSRVERVGVREVHRFTTDDGVTSALLLGLEVPSTYPAADLDDVPEAEELDGRVEQAGNDAWSVLDELGIASRLEFPTLPAAQLADLARIERAQPSVAAPLFAANMIGADPDEEFEREAAPMARSRWCLFRPCR